MSTLQDFFELKFHRIKEILSAQRKVGRYKCRRLEMNTGNLIRRFGRDGYSSRRSWDE